MIQRIAFVCMIVLPLGGCQRTGAGANVDAGGPTGTTTWHLQPPDKTAVIPGIDQGGAQYVGRILVIWSAASKGGGSSSSSGITGMRGKGHVSFSEAPPVAFEFSTPDGKTGPVVIGGVKYQLSDGPLFLLARDGEKLRVKQLKKDLGTLDLNAEGFQRFGRNDSEIMEFFTSKKPAE